MKVFNSIWLIKPTFQHLYPFYINNFCCSFQNTERVYNQQSANKVKYLKNKRVDLLFWNCWNVLANSMPRKYCQQWILMLNLKSEFSVNISNIQTDKTKSRKEIKMKERDNRKCDEHHFHHWDIWLMFFS